MLTVQTIAQQPRVQEALKQFDTNIEALIDRAIAIQQIPAPTFSEQERAAFVQTTFTALGLHDISQDQWFNVYARLPGSRSNGHPIIVSAHSDTVFSAETDLTIRREDNKIHGPGIADNSTGVAGLLTLAETMRHFELQPERDVWFVANSGEEGLGDLIGMRAVADRFPTGEYIVIEGGMYGSVLHAAIGVRRFEIAVATQGGHSWSEFGRTNAIHVLGHLIAAIDGIDVPRRPKTTYTIGIVEGGTSINTIASSARLLLDVRSVDNTALQHIVGTVETVVKQTRRTFRDANITMTQIGHRPSGKIPRNAMLVQSADAALAYVGYRNIQHLAGSTDANIPLSRGYPAVCIGLANSANAHRLDEYLDTTHLTQGMQQLLLLTLTAGQNNT
ncbi:MAG: M20/M25/M40 family metallo-hydrolase [Anaerolineae bacterium]|nr:M20/M25/M40 family metallo-hydrolase [Anaerolineae bacterium]